MVDRYGNATEAKGTVRTRVLVISLADAAERRAHFRARADDCGGIDWSFFDAHRAPGPQIVYDPGAALRIHGRALEPGELGVYSSHTALWQALLDDGQADQYMIFEDDVIVDWPALAVVAAHDFAASGHHYIRLFARKPSPFRVLATDYLPGPRALLMLTGKPFGAQAYVITKSGAQAMLHACRHAVRPIDDEMDRFWDHGIPNLALFPFPVIERFSPSHIGGERFVKQRAKRSRIARWRDTLRRRLAVARMRFL